MRRLLAVGRSAWNAKFHPLWPLSVWAARRCGGSRPACYQSLLQSHPTLPWKSVGPSQRRSAQINRRRSEDQIVDPLVLETRVGALWTELGLHQIGTAVVPVPRSSVPPTKLAEFHRVRGRWIPPDLQKLSASACLLNCGPFSLDHIQQRSLKVNAPLVKRREYLCIMASTGKRLALGSVQSRVPRCVGLVRPILARPVRALPVWSGLWRNSPALPFQVESPKFYASRPVFFSLQSC